MDSLIDLPGKKKIKFTYKSTSLSSAMLSPTTIIPVESNLTMIQGDLLHIDRSTTITNRNSFNIESIVTANVVGDSDGKVVIGS